MRAKSLMLGTILITISIGIYGCVGSGANISGIRTLMKLGQNDKLKQRTLKLETRNFQRVKKYIVNNRIKTGISAKYAIKKFGEPVSVLSKPEGEKWAYKPSDADWIGGEKIYLFFDNEGSLLDWECVNCR